MHLHLETGLHTTAAPSHTDLSSHEQGRASTGGPDERGTGNAMRRGWKFGSGVVFWQVTKSWESTTPEIGAREEQCVVTFISVGFR